MKKNLFFIIAFGWCLTSFAQDNPQKFTVILFADTKDTSIGQGVSKSVNNVKNFIAEIETATGLYRDYEYGNDFVGSECTKNNLDMVLSSFTCDTNDIVVFFYLGHGARSIKDTSPFPQMAMGSGYDDDFVSLVHVQNELLKHNPRLCLIFADCCNSVGNWTTKEGKEPPIYYAAMMGEGPTEISLEKEKLFRKLFLETSGCVMSCGSEMKEYSWTNPLTGSYFTNGMIESVQSLSANVDTITKPWESVLALTKKTVSEKDFYKNGEFFKQHPYYRINSRRIRVPKPPVSPVLTNNIQSSLSYVANAGNGYAKRENMAKKTLEMYFSGDDALVITIAQNGTTVLDYETAKDYFARICQAKRMSNIVVHDQLTDNNGKITQLVVHEIYVSR